MPSDLPLLSTLTGSNYPCLELIFMVPKVFDPLKLDCKRILNTLFTANGIKIYAYYRDKVLFFIKTLSLSVLNVKCAK